MTAAHTIVKWRRDPVAFVREQFGVEADAWQVDVLRAFANPKLPRISMQACAGPGKTAVIAWCICWFLATQGAVGDHPKGFAASVTSDNLKANLWPELAKWQNRSPYMSAAFTWTAERMYANDHKATWFVEARSWPKTASPEEQGKTLSGLHGGYVAAFLDESGAIPVPVSRAAEQALSTNPTFGKILQGGNPLSREGMLYAASVSHLWHIIRITGDPDDPKRSPRISIDWAREQIAAYGRDNPWVMAYILGQFPLAAINSLLSPDDVRAAMAREPKPEAFEHAARIMGVDVAREGDDRSIIFRRQGIASLPPEIVRNASSLHGAGLVARLWGDWDADAAFIDGTGGFGSGWIDQLQALGRAPIGIHFASKASTERYANKRAEMWFAMAEWVKAGGCLPNCPEIIAELTTPTYTFKGDAVILEDKRQIKSRLGRSPDLADALALTFAHPVKRKTALQRFAAEHRGERAHGGEYDPYDRARMR